MSSWFSPAALPTPPSSRSEAQRRAPPPNPNSSYSSLPSGPAPPTRTSSSRPRPPIPQYNDAPQYSQHNDHGDDSAYARQNQPPPHPTRSNQSSGQNRGRPGRYNVIESPSPAFALTNCLIVNDQDWGGVAYVVIKDQFVLTIK